VEDVNKVVSQCRNHIVNGKQFAVLIPVSIAGEIARLENSGGDRHYDDELLKKVEGMSRIILAQDAEMWLLNLNSHRINEFIPVHLQGTDEAQGQEIIHWAIDRFRNNKAKYLTLRDNHTNGTDVNSSSCPVMLPTTRSQRSIARGGDSKAQQSDDNGGDSSIDTPAADSVLGGSREGSTSDGRIIPAIRERKIRWERQPREPLPPLEDVKEWVTKTFPLNIKACHRRENLYP
jgi:hypothetical protein